MTKFRQAFMDTMKILQEPNDDVDGAPLESHSEVSSRMLTKERAAVEKILGYEGLNAYTSKLMGFYNGEIAKLKNAISAIQVKEYIGTLSAGATSINVGSTLYRPAVYLDGVRIDKNSFTFSGTTINLKEAYSKKYSVVWYVEDTGSPARLLGIDTELQPSKLYALPIEEDAELVHNFTNNNIHEIWNLGVDISNYRRLSLLIGDNTILELNTKILIKNKTISTKVIFINNENDSFYKENLMVFELVNNNSIRIKSIYNDTKEKVNSLIKDLKCEIFLEK